MPVLTQKSETLNSNEISKYLEIFFQVLRIIFSSTWKFFSKYLEFSTQVLEILFSAKINEYLS